MSAFWIGALTGSAGTIVAALFLWWAALRVLPSVFDLFDTFADRRRRW